jgi:DNA-binding response OmpR family regulator
MSRIVIAEDDPHILKIISLWMTRQGYAVVEARNGQIARDLLAEAPADVLVTDVQMPMLDGLGLVDFAVRERRVRCGIVVLTNRWDHGEIANQLEAIKVRVMPKPFSPSKLAELVAGLLGAAEPTGVGQ